MRVWALASLFKVDPSLATLEGDGNIYSTPTRKDFDFAPRWILGSDKADHQTKFPGLIMDSKWGIYPNRRGLVVVNLLCKKRSLREQAENGPSNHLACENGSPGERGQVVTFALGVGNFSGFFLALFGAAFGGASRLSRGGPGATPCSNI